MFSSPTLCSLTPRKNGIPQSFSAINTMPIFSKEQKKQRSTGLQWWQTRTKPSSRRLDILLSLSLPPLRETQWCIDQLPFCQPFQVLLMDILDSGLAQLLVEGPGEFPGSLIGPHPYACLGNQEPFLGRPACVASTDSDHRRCCCWALKCYHLLIEGGITSWTLGFGHSKHAILDFSTSSWFFIKAG